jgi:hypothetical protein
MTELTSEREAAGPSPNRTSQSAILVGSTLPKHAARAHAGVEYWLASLGLEHRSPSGVRPAQHRVCFLLQYPRHIEHSSCVHAESFSHTHDRGSLLAVMRLTLAATAHLSLRVCAFVLSASAASRSPLSCLLLTTTAALPTPLSALQPVPRSRPSLTTARRTAP